MPELPEVETVVRDIRPKIKGKKILAAEICGYKPVLGGSSIAFINKKIAGKKVKDVCRRGKHILILLEEGCLDIHLRMTGQLQFCKERPDHTTFILNFGINNLYFADTRKFGRVLYHSSVAVLDRKLGVEPLTGKFNFEYLRNILKSKKRMIKPLLLDQKYIAGIGNIYADEALYLAGIHPKKQSSKVSDLQTKKLCQAIKIVLQKSIDFQGTTFINFAYGDSQSGNFQNSLRVFDRQGRACKRCKTVIKKIWVGQRGTHFCPQCQILK